MIGEQIKRISLLQYCPYLLFIKHVILVSAERTELPSHRKEEKQVRLKFRGYKVLDLSQLSHELLPE